MLDHVYFKRGILLVKNQPLLWSASRETPIYLFLLEEGRIAHHYKGLENVHGLIRTQQSKVNDNTLRLLTLITSGQRRGHASDEVLQISSVNIFPRIR